MIKYTLPDLRYDYGALEPHVSGRIMELHHDKHHKTYVDGANKALEELHEARAAEEFGRLAQLEKALAFNASGHVLHSLFWQNLSPDGGGEPDGELAAAIRQSFGSFDALKSQMNEAAATIMGSGWAALVWDPLAGQLLAAQLHDHQSETIQASVPLLVMDAWEHAYYLQYHNEKAKFFEALWNLWNWTDIAERFVAARRNDLRLTAVAGNGASRPKTARRQSPQPPAGRA